MENVRRFRRTKMGILWKILIVLVLLFSISLYFEPELTKEVLKIIANFFIKAVYWLFTEGIPKAIIWIKGL